MLLLLQNLEPILENFQTFKITKFPTVKTTTGRRLGRPINITINTNIDIDIDSDSDINSNSIIIVVVIVILIL